MMEMYKPTLEPIRRSTLTTNEVAEYLGVSIDTIFKLVREKRIVHFRIGRRILFKKEAIDKWVDEQMKVSVEDEY
ncbi:helix-turn-helix domain-containing protein [Virgibacillus sp. YIM 98842]|uniref:helix-turn-helix domain-containing protein n=1 Tax=Virgibacillus sp. YIM 98842 TaxID=2663533 RepID=UPI003204BCB7